MTFRTDQGEPYCGECGRTFNPAAPQGEAPSVAVPVAWACTDYDGRVGVGITQAEAKQRAGEHCNEFFPLFSAPSALQGQTQKDNGS